MSTAMDKNSYHKPRRRVSQVYVELPPLLHASSSSSRSVTSEGSRKENAPPPPMDTPSDPFSVSVSIKRKISCLSRVYVEIDSPASKKVKRASPHGINSTEFPIGKQDAFNEPLYFCHQCSRKFTKDKIQKCTSILPNKKHCQSKYCSLCLQRRYGGYAGYIRPEQSSGQFECPKCRKICNCRYCMKSKGMQAIGKLTPTGSKIAGTSKKDTSNIINDDQLQVLTSTEVDNIKDDAVSKPRSALAGPRAKAKRLPTLRWSSVPTYLSLNAAEDRIHIREFVVRFAEVMTISRVHIEELEELGGTKSRSCSDSATDDLPGWVSEACAKATILALLDLFTQEHASSTKVIRNVMKQIRGTGVNLHKIWILLSEMRDSLSNPASSLAIDSLCRLSAPIHLSSSTKVHCTRRGGIQDHTTPYIVHSAQLVPVITSIIDAAIQTVTIREDFDAGASEGKEKTKKFREAIKGLVESWEEGKDDEKIAEDKSKRAAHKCNLANHEMSLKVALANYIPRIAPLGKDSDGRVYWALTPGATEREVALDIISSKSNTKGKFSTKKQRKLLPTEEERSAMKSWSWFIGVWGKRPALETGEQTKNGKDHSIQREREGADVSDDDGDKNSEGWWGFWEPKEIKKLATWVSIKGGLEEASSRKVAGESGQKIKSLTSGEDVNDSVSLLDGTKSVVPDVPSQKELEVLTKRLREYALMLEWRLSRGRDIENNRT